MQHSYEVGITIFHKLENLSVHHSQTDYSICLKLYMEIEFLGHSYMHFPLICTQPDLFAICSTATFPPCIMCVQYIGRCSVHRGVSWVHRGVSWVHRGMFSTSGGYHDERGGYHDERGGIPWVHWRMFSTSEGIMIHVGEQLDKIFSISIENSNVLNIPLMYWTSPDVLMISPDVLMISPRCTHGIPPMYSWYPPDVLNIPSCTHGIPPHVSWYPPMYWTSP